MQRIAKFCTKDGILSFDSAEAIARQPFNEGNGGRWIRA